jgi:uncharacterized protein YbbC (DUF1343 family)
LTNLLGELGAVNIGVGYTLPFKVIGAPWIDASLLERELKRLKLPGIDFQAYCFRPFFGLYKGELCQGVRLRVVDPSIYRPISAQFHIAMALKKFYPTFLEKAMAQKAGRREMLDKVSGTAAFFDVMRQETKPTALLRLHASQKRAFSEKRLRYLLPEYGP